MRSDEMPYPFSSELPAGIAAALNDDYQSSLSHLLMKVYESEKSTPHSHATRLPVNPQQYWMVLPRE
jgi:hypothetical protein